MNKLLFSLVLAIGAFMVSCSQSEKNTASNNTEAIDESKAVVETPADTDVEGISFDELEMPTESTATYTVNSASGDRYRTYVKTKFKCDKCSGCSGYWGYRHQNGTYEGNCRNSDGHGHTCGHSPQHHGLKAW
ncbi:MAG: hypothetical protein LIP09_05385 [Bacteroidales bacterium]|nr:hypothetical protein [Bacteroidales bacterium]